MAPVSWNFELDGRDVSEYWDGGWGLSDISVGMIKTPGGAVERLDCLEGAAACDEKSMRNFIVSAPLDKGGTIIKYIYTHTT